MHQVAALLTAWNTFYAMIGSATASLTGLMFVVITLAGNTRRGASEDGVSAFSTPTVVHFSAALFTAALMSAPFRSLVPIEVMLFVLGVAGCVHVVRVARRTARLQSYKPDAEDWTWHVFLPLCAYATYAAGAFALHVAPRAALYAPAAAAILLIFIGIHNSWDVVTFLATGKAEELRDGPDAAARDGNG